MFGKSLIRWLVAPPLSGLFALLCGTILVAIPTLVRLAVSGVVSGCEFTPYLPFVLVSAILLRWWQAGLIALASVAILGGVLGGHVHDLACFLSGAALFLASSAVIIGAMVLTRFAFAAIASRGADEEAGGIVFSLDKDQVWASWYGQGPPMLLGSKRKVSAMMEDFLAQVEVAKRLNKK